MKQGWFIPATLFGFGLAMTGLWLYLTLADTDSPPQPRVVTVDEPFPGLGRSHSSKTASGQNENPQAAKRNETRRVLANASARVADDQDRNAPSMPKTSPIAALRSWRREATQNIDKLAGSIDDDINRWKSNAGSTALLRVANGWQLLNENKARLALAEFDRAIKRDETEPAALAGRAAALVALGHFEAASEAYRTLLEICPADANARYNLGVIEGRIGRLTDAAKQFRLALQIDPKHTRAWFNLASLAQRDGRLAEARTGWESFTKLEPSIAAGWYNLGIVYMDYQNPAEAARCFSYVVMIDPTDVDGYVNLAEAYRAEGDFETALGILHQADQLSPCDPVVLNARAQSHRSLAALHPEDEETHLAEAGQLESALAEMEPDTTGEELAADTTAAD